MFGKPVKPGSVGEVVAIALPMVVSYACDTVMIFTDRLFLAKQGPVFMNAVMGGGLGVFMMMSFVLGLTGYTTAIAAQYLGAEQKEKCSVVTTQALLLVLASYPVILACRPLAHGFFEIMGVSPEQLGPQKEYFDLMLFGVIISLTRHTLSSFFSGIGNTAIVMAASLTAMLVNVLLCYILIHGKLGFPALGIKGAAYATIVGAFSGVLVLAARYFSREVAAAYGVMKSFLYNREVMSKLWKFGTPAGFEFFLNILSFNIMVFLFHSAGPVSATATTIVFNWDMVSFVPLIGLEVAVTSLVGRSMGAGNPAMAHRSTMSALKFGLVYSSVIFVLFVLFPGPLVGVFSPGSYNPLFTDAVPIAITMLRLASLYVFLQAMMLCMIGALRGAGDTLWAMWMTVGVHWTLVVVLFVMLRILGLSPQQGWIALILVFFVFSYVVYLRYSSGAWKKLSILTEGPP